MTSETVENPGNSKNVHVFINPSNPQPQNPPLANRVLLNHQFYSQNGKLISSAAGISAT